MGKYSEVSGAADQIREAAQKEAKDKGHKYDPREFKGAPDEVKAGLSDKWINEGARKLGYSPEKVYKALGLSPDASPEEKVARFKEFQKDKGLVGRDGEPDGIIGPKSLEALDDASDGFEKPATRQDGTPYAPATPEVNVDEEEEDFNREQEEEAARAAQEAADKADLEGKVNDAVKPEQEAFDEADGKLKSAQADVEKAEGEQRNRLKEIKDTKAEATTVEDQVKQYEDKLEPAKKELDAKTADKDAKVTAEKAAKDAYTDTSTAVQGINREISTAEAALLANTDPSQKPALEAAVQAAKDKLRPAVEADNLAEEAWEKAQAETTLAETARLAAETANKKAIDDHTNEKQKLEDLLATIEELKKEFGEKALELEELKEKVEEAKKPAEEAKQALEDRKKYFTEHPENIPNLD